MSGACIRKRTGGQHHVVAVEGKDRGRLVTGYDAVVANPWLTGQNEVQCLTGGIVEYWLEVELWVRIIRHI